MGRVPGREPARESGERRWRAVNEVVQCLVVQEATLHAGDEERGGTDSEDRDGRQPERRADDDREERGERDRVIRTSVMPRVDTGGDAGASVAEPSMKRVLEQRASECADGKQPEGRHARPLEDDVADRDQRGCREKIDDESEPVVPRRRGQSPRSTRREAFESRVGSGCCRSGIDETHVAATASDSDEDPRRTRRVCSCEVDTDHLRHGSELSHPPHQSTVAHRGVGHVVPGRGRRQRSRPPLGDSTRRSLRRPPGGAGRADPPRSQVPTLRPHLRRA